MRRDVRARANQPAQTSRVGVRELRQNLSVYLRRVVVGGERLEVTEHGRPVAMLVPRQATSSIVDRLVAEGRAIPPSRRIEELAPTSGRGAGRFGRRVQQALRELRDDPR